MMPVLYLSHGAPPLVDDELWVTELAAWAADLPVPKAILVVSAHWEAAPLTIGSTSVETPLTVMYPAASIPVLQISLPTLDPQRLVHLGERLRPLRDDGVLLIGSGFTTHGLPFLDDPSPAATPPRWSVEFDGWAAERFSAGDLDGLIDFRNKAPGMPYAHPTIEHFAPLFVALGASGNPEQPPRQVVDGFWMGLAKRSIQLI